MQGIALRYSYMARRSWSVMFWKVNHGITWRRAPSNGAGTQFALTTPAGQVGWRHLGAGPGCFSGDIDRGCCGRGRC